MIKGALNLPRISCTNREQENMKEVINEIEHSKSVVTFYETSKGEYKFLFTDLGVKEFTLLVMTILRHKEVFELFKLIIITIEKINADFEKTLDYINKAVEYIRLKQKK